MTKQTVLCSVPNTLLDSRIRTTEAGVYITGIETDKLNYPVLLLLKDFEKLGYSIVLTHYCLNRLRTRITNKLSEYKLPQYVLYTNFTNQEVYDDTTLALHTFDYLSEEHSIKYVIDNNPKAEAGWLNRQVSLIKVPLGVL